MSSLARSALAAMVVAVAAFAPAIAAERWVHIHVDETGADGARVRIQLPLSVVRAALPHVEADGLEGGRLRLSDDAVDPGDLAAARVALRDALDGKVVEVGDPDRPFRLERSGGWIILAGTEPDGGRIRLQVPSSVARDVLRDLPGKIDLLAILGGIEEAGDAEIASIEDGDTSVRIWIDASVKAE